LHEQQLDALRDAIEPAVASLGVGLYDVELLGGASARTLRVTVTRAGGVDLDTITDVTRAVSPIVDDAAPVNGSYLLEVSSPGIERALRRPEHYVSAVLSEVSIKFHTDDGPRRVRGILADFDGTTAVVETEAGEREPIALASITQARTVFSWGPQSRPGNAKRTRTRAKERS
jgi:ribosome maturation factor RimP